MIKKLAQYLVRPIRNLYEEESDLGERRFSIGDYEYLRTDYDVDCVIFCHGNSGNRCSIFECLEFILDSGLVAVSFDFAGCGNSEGEFISLGQNEKFDIQSIVKFIKTFSNIGKIALWGRSMGAASVLLYTQLECEVNALCLDSPFRSLNSLIQDFIDKFAVLADLFGDLVYSKLHSYIKKEFSIDINEVKPIEAARSSFLSAIFVHGAEDNLIKKDHTDDIVEIYKGRKKYFNVNGGHNDLRNDSLYIEVINFFLETFSNSRKNEKQEQEQADIKEQIKKPVSQIVVVIKDKQSSLDDFSPSGKFQKQGESISKLCFSKSNFQRTMTVPNFNEISRANCFFQEDECIQKKELNLKEINSNKVLNTKGDEDRVSRDSSPCYDEDDENNLGYFLTETISVMQKSFQDEIPMTQSKNQLKENQQRVADEDQVPDEDIDRIFPEQNIKNCKFMTLSKTSVWAKEIVYDKASQ